MELHDGGVRVEQRLEALASANRLRTARAGLKRRIAAGEVSCADVLLHQRWEVESMSIGALLVSQRHWGDQRCRQFLGLVEIGEGKSVGSMTERQRRMVVAALGAPPSDDVPLRGERAHR